MKLSMLLVAWLLIGIAPVRAGVNVIHEFNSDGNATAGFKFKQVPAPSKNDAGTGATWTMVDGQPDGNGGGLSRLHDDQLPRSEDQPEANFFLRAGLTGGRWQVDLGSVRTIQQINSYSWHPDTRGPQVYQVYVSEGTGAGFQAAPKRDIDPSVAGWKLLAKVDTRPAEGSGGGQHGVSIQDPAGPLGTFRYVLFEVAPTETRDAFGNTFYSEIDLIDPKDPLVAASAGTGTETKPITSRFASGDGGYQFTMDTTLAPDLTEWAERELRPVVQAWYPKLVTLLPSEGFSPRTNVTIRFRDNMGGTPASAGGGFINCNAGWFRRELKREALGSVVHEMVHVVQSYGRVRRDDPNAMRMPGWLVEGIPDYIRWYLYEPQTKGAEITTRNLARAKYDASYRITGNFLDWVSRSHDSNIVVKLNAAGRAGRYRPELWKESTGKTVEELGEAWRKFHEQRLGVEPKPAAPAETSPPAKP